MRAKLILHTAVLWLALFVPWVVGSKAQSGRRYFVSVTGDDRAAGDGLAMAWRTLDRANRHQFAPGDELLLQGGETFVGNLVFDANDRGSAAQPITIGSYGAGRATVQAGTGTGILVADSGGFVVKDLILLGQNQSAGQASGVAFLNRLPRQTKLAFIRIENVEAHGFGMAGILVMGAPADGSQSGYDDVAIMRCLVYDNLYYGIFVSGAWDNRAATYANRDVVIADCVAHDNPGDPNFHRQHSGNGILLDNVEGGLIERCVAYHNGYANGSRGGGPVGIWAHSADRVTIQFCESYGNRTAGKADGGGFDFDGGVTNSVMQYNYSHDNDGPGFMLWNYAGAPHMLRGNTIRYNLSVNDARRHHYGGIHIGSDGEPISDADVYHNTVITPTAVKGEARALWLGYYEGWHPSYNIRLRNNLFMTTGDVPLVEISPGQSGIVLQGNAYWNTTGNFQALAGDQVWRSLAAWRAATGYESLDGVATGLWGDPLFVRPGEGKSLGLFGYQLHFASPLINRALDLRERFGLDSGARDYWGTPLPQGGASDIGAHEWTRKVFPRPR